MHKTAQNEAWLSGLKAQSMTWKGQLVRAHLLIFPFRVLYQFWVTLKSCGQGQINACMSHSLADRPHCRSVQLLNEYMGKIKHENIISSKFEYLETKKWRIKDTSTALTHPFASSLILF